MTADNFCSFSSTSCVLWCSDCCKKTQLRQQFFGMGFSHPLQRLTWAPPGQRWGTDMYLWTLKHVKTLVGGKKKKKVNTALETCCTWLVRQSVKQTFQQSSDGDRPHCPQEPPQLRGLRSEFLLLLLMTQDQNSSIMNQNPNMWKYF